MATRLPFEPITMEHLEPYGQKDVIGFDPIADEDLTRRKRLFESKDIVNIENLCNLELCGEDLFWFSCFSLKITDCDGSPIRVVAWFE